MYISHITELLLYIHTIQKKQQPDPPPTKWKKNNTTQGESLPNRTCAWAVSLQGVDVKP